MKSKSRFVSFLKILIPVALVAGLGLLFTRGLRQEAVVTPVVRGEAIDAVPGSITVKPEFDVTIKAEVGGRIKESSMRVGEMVEEGDFLFEIDPTDLRLQYEAFKAEYEAFKAQIELKEEDRVALENKKEDLENYERLYREGSISSLEIERHRKDFELFLERQESKRIAEERELRFKEIKLKEWQRTLEKTTQTAPNSGIIEKVFAYPGEIISSGADVAVLVSDQMRIEAKVNEENFAGVQVGQPARIRFLTFGDRLFEATVSKVLPQADPETQQYTVYLELDRGHENLLSGLTGEVSIIKARREDTLLVPRRALFGSYLFVVNNGVVEMRNVKVGFTGLNQAEIVSGLKEGDLVVADEIDRFRDGDAVAVTIEEEG